MKIISIILLSVIISVFAVYLLIVGRYEKKLKTEKVEAILPATSEGLYSNVKIDFSEVDNKATESSYIRDLSDD